VIVGQLGWEDLESDRALEARIVSKVDLAHASGANPGTDFVSAEFGIWGKGHSKNSG
jgi:hypothetical protein